VTGHQNMYLPGVVGAVKLTSVRGEPAGMSTLVSTPRDGDTKAWAKEQLVKSIVTFSPALAVMVLVSNTRPTIWDLMGVPGVLVAVPPWVYGPGAGSPRTPAGVTNEGLGWAEGEPAGLAEAAAAPEAAGLAAADAAGDGAGQPDGDGGVCGFAAAEPAAGLAEAPAAAAPEAAGLAEADAAAGDEAADGFAAAEAATDGGALEAGAALPPQAARPSMALRLARCRT